jgi:hypothetical protein
MFTPGWPGHVAPNKTGFNSKKLNELVGTP